MKFSRRRFIAVSTVLASALAVGRRATAADAGAGVVQETDANAQALGYKADAGRVDHAKYPKFHAGDACANCQFFQGKAGATTGRARFSAASRSMRKAGATVIRRRRSQAGMTWRPCNRNAVVAGVVAREYRPVSEHAERRRPDRPRAPWRTPTRCAGSSTYNVSVRRPARHPDFGDAQADPTAILQGHHGNQMDRGFPRPRSVSKLFPGSGVPQRHAVGFQPPHPVARTVDRGRTDRSQQLSAGADAGGPPVPRDGRGCAQPPVRHARHHPHRAADRRQEPADCRGPHDRAEFPAGLAQGARAAFRRSAGARDSDQCP